MLISAIVTTHNRPGLCRRALGSVLRQTYAPLEIIVVEDGSDSGIGSWCTEACSGRVRYLRHETSRGLGSARNTGWRAAGGEYVAFLDDDDAWKEERVARMVRAVEEDVPAEAGRPEVVSCGVEVIDENGAPVTALAPQITGDIRGSIRGRGLNTLSSNLLVLRRALEAAGGFDETLPSCVDHDLWMTLAVSGGRALGVADALVLMDRRQPREKLMKHPERRIAGVRSFLNKWRPVHGEWFGPGGLRRYEMDYFTGVVSDLARDLAADGRLGEALRVLGCVWRYGGRRGMRAKANRTGMLFIKGLRRLLRTGGS